LDTSAAGVIAEGEMTAGAFERANTVEEFEELGVMAQQETQMRYAICCTPPDSLLRDEDTMAVIYFDTYVEAQAEAVRLTQEAQSNPRVKGIEFRPEPLQ
jgi:hypothetical protein